MLCFIKQKVLDDSVNNNFNISDLSIVIGTCEVLIDCLEPADIVMSVSDQVDSDVSTAVPLSEHINVILELLVLLVPILILERLDKPLVRQSAVPHRGSLPAQAQQ